MRAVVTGGAGFVGSHVVRRLLGEGLEVVVVDLPNARLDNLTGLAVRHHPADIRIPGSVRAALDGCDVLFHLAATPRLWEPDRNEYRRVNTEGTRNVLAAAAEAHVPRVVYTSTESIIGPSKDGAVCNEDTVSREEEMVGPYCLSKFLAERAAVEAAERGLDVVIVNPTVPVGPGDINQSPPAKMILEFLHGKIPAYIDCHINIVDVRDAAEGHLLAWKKGARGRRYILAGENVSVRRIFEMVGEIVGRKPPRIRLPLWFALGAAYVSEFIADHVTHRPPRANVTGVKLAKHFMHFDASRAVHELGYRPSPVRQALADAVAWYREQGWI